MESAISIRLLILRIEGKINHVSHITLMYTFDKISGRHVKIDILLI